MTTNALIDRAVAVAGSQARLAKACGVRQQTISKVRLGQIRVAAELAVAIDRATAGAVPKEALRPDLFAAPPAVAAGAACVAAGGAAGV